jgi:hypothetical protein
MESINTFAVHAVAAPKDSKGRESMKSAIACSCLGLPALLLSSVAYGQAVTAHERLTEETINSNGKVIASHIREGVYYRTSAGSTLRQYTTLDGNAIVGQLGWAILQDGTGTYKLDYTQHRAYVVSGPQATPLSGIPTTQKAQSSVEGMPCTLWPVYLVEAGTKTIIGQGCHSDKYNLTLKLDVTVPGKNGQSAHNVTEMYDVQIGQEPDAKLFDVQHNFTIFKPNAAK